jgi:hypothetical protein
MLRTAGESDTLLGPAMPGPAAGFAAGGLSAAPPFVRAFSAPQASCVFGSSQQFQFLYISRSIAIYLADVRTRKRDIVP